MDPAARLPAPDVDPLAVGKAFVFQYYDILHNMPDQMYRFYQEISQVGRVGHDGVMRLSTTLQGISEEHETLSHEGFEMAKIISYDTQTSHNGGLCLAVTGYFLLKDTLRKKFFQTFFLAPQENGYFVLNDILRFVNETDAIDGEDSETPSFVTAPTGNKGSEQSERVSLNPVCKEVSNSLNNESASVSKENVLVPEIVNEEGSDIKIICKEVSDMKITCKEVADDSLKVSDLDNVPAVPKKSYVSVLKVTKDKSGVSAGSLPSPKKIPRNQEHQVSSDSSPEQILKDQGQKASSDHSPVTDSDAVSEVVNPTENEHNHGFEAVTEGRSVYVKHLPGNANINMLETEFKQFGSISNDGIQVIYQRDFGFPYGFVEFEDAAAAQKAIKASPMMIGGQRAYVEEKQSTSRGNRGNGNGNRNVGVRGRGRGSYGYGNSYRRGGGRGGGRSFNRRGDEYVARNNTY